MREAHLPAAHKYGSWVAVRPKINQSPETARVHIWCNFKLFVGRRGGVVGPAGDGSKLQSDTESRDGGGGGGDWNYW